MVNINLDLEMQYQAYLHKMKLIESDMDSTQKIETRRAFYAGISALMSIMDLVGQMGEKDALISVATIDKQVKRFWENEKKPLNNRK